MKVIQVNNFHRIIGGSDVVATSTIELLRSRGIEVSCLSRDSRRLGRGLSGRFRAFGNGIYCASACKEMQKELREICPDIVQVHEVFPFISPWVLQICRRWNVPVVMSCHNFRLTCPTGHHVSGRAVCERCTGGREYWCLLKNCRENVFESTAYALRSAVARKLGLFKRNVTLFLTLSNFLKGKLIDAGVDADRIAVLPNMASVPKSTGNPSRGKYFAFVGRISAEKGVHSLMAAARRTNLPVKLAGDYSVTDRLLSSAPTSVEFVGFMKRDQLDFFYRNARCLVLPSRCFEVNPLAVLEAMSYGLPVIASRIAGIPELVEDGKTGLLFEPGDSAELAMKMNTLWEDPDFCWKMGQAGRRKAIQEYSEEVYFKRLLAIYEKAIEMKRKDGGG